MSSVNKCRLFLCINFKLCFYCAYLLLVNLSVFVLYVTFFLTSAGLILKRILVAEMADFWQSKRVQGYDRLPFESDTKWWTEIRVWYPSLDLPILIPISSWISNIAQTSSHLLHKCISTINFLICWLSLPAFGRFNNCF